MRRTKLLSMVLAAALAISSIAVAPVNADAAKKPKLSKSKANVYVGKTVKITVKNGKKNAKVTWSLTKKGKKYVRITKKSTKGNKAYATVKGLKKGKTTLTAKYKLGKKTTKLKCTITVKKASSPVVTNAPIVSNAPTTAPTSAPTSAPTNVPTSAPTNEPTKAPTATPIRTATPVPTATAVPTPTPTFKPMPKDILVDLSKGEGSGSYNEATKQYIIDDDSAEDATITFFKLDESVNVGEKLNIHVKGNYTGDTGFRFWLGNGQNAYSTPVVFPADRPAGPIDETFEITVEGDEVTEPATILTIKCIPGWSGGKDYIAGLTIDSIVINYVDRGVVEEPTETPAVPTETPAVPTETPAVPTDSPAVPTETPVVPTETPVVPTETPVVPEPVEVVSKEVKLPIQADEMTSVVLSKENEAINDPINTIDYVDGKAKVSLSPKYSGFGVAYYIDAVNHSAVNVSEYEDLVVTITSDKEYNVVVEGKTGIQNNSYWDNGSTAIDTRYLTIQPGTNEYTFSYSSPIEALFIKFNTFRANSETEPEIDYNADFTIDSIKYYDSATADLYELPDDVKNADVSFTFRGKDYAETVEFLPEDIDALVEEYSDAYTLINKLADKTAGDIERFYGENASVKYTAAEAGKGTFEAVLNDNVKTGEVEFVKSEDKTVAYVSYNGRNAEVTVTADDESTAVVKTNRGTYTVTADVADDGSYEATVTSETGKFAIVTKTAEEKYSVITSKGLGENKEFSIVCKF